MRIIYLLLAYLLLVITPQAIGNAKINLNEQKYEDGLWAFRERCK